MSEINNKPNASRGFILVMLLIFITAMGIFLTVALPRVATEVQRDQEAELVFRGEAIASAIRQYKAKTGGYPLTLEDLTKVRPRIIRKLYQDPMTTGGPHEGEWDLITAVQPGASGDKTGLPIVGVRSTCPKDSFLVYHDKTLISDWTFSAADNLLGIPGANAASAAAAAGLLPAGLVPGATPAQPQQPGVDLSALGPPAGGASPPARPPAANPPLANQPAANPPPATPPSDNPASDNPPPAVPPGANPPPATPPAAPPQPSQGQPQN